MVRLPDKATFDDRWAKMGWRERREILRMVGKGQAMRKRSDARVAVMAARQQQRYWRFAWLLGPLVSLILIPDWIALAINAVLISVVSGAFAVFKHRRAKAAEQANLQRLQR